MGAQGDPVPEAVRGLPAVFSYTQALQAGLSSDQFYRLRDAGWLEPLARGLYRRRDQDTDADTDLITIAHRARDATVCLVSALAQHDLIDDIPTTIDIALPRDRYRPRIPVPVTWHAFDPATFTIGRTTRQLDPNTSIGLYGPERSIIDAIRLRHREDQELGYTALKRWLRRPGSSPGRLASMASHFPHADRALRNALEILL